MRLKLVSWPVDNQSSTTQIMSSEMYASTFQPRPTPLSGQTGLYRQVGVQTGVDAATPHHLTSMLFDGLLEAMALARGALRSGQVEAKCAALGRAVRIVDEGLKASLDLQNGGEVAHNLSNLYAYVSMRLTQANLRNDEPAIEECVRLIEPIRDAWKSIGARGAHDTAAQKVSA